VLEVAEVRAGYSQTGGGARLTKLAGRLVKRKGAADPPAQSGGAGEVLHGVSLRAEKGEIVAIIGPNGAGKSTLMRAIFGLIAKSGGRVQFKGEDVTALQPQELVQRGMALVPQERSSFPSLTVAENLEMGAFTRADRRGVRKDIDRLLDRFPIIGRRRDKEAMLLSGGERQFLSIARALMLHPDLMMLDEPSTGLAPKTVEEVFQIVRELNGEGTTVIVVEQNARLALEVADRAYVLETGRIQLEGPGKALLDDDRVRQIYLGEGA
jgi:branched-chain amino acid transport system ATP-binding protein